MIAQFPENSKLDCFDFEIHINFRRKKPAQEQPTVKFRDHIDIKKTNADNIVKQILLDELVFKTLSSSFTTLHVFLMMTKNYDEKNDRKSRAILSMRFISHKLQLCKCTMIAIKTHKIKTSLKIDVNRTGVRVIKRAIN